MIGFLAAFACGVVLAYVILRYVLEKFFLGYFRAQLTRRYPNLTSQEKQLLAMDMAAKLLGGTNG